MRLGFSEAMFQDLFRNTLSPNTSKEEWDIGLPGCTQGEVILWKGQRRQGDLEGMNMIEVHYTSMEMSSRNHTTDTH